jgi:hypothetical protein
MPDIIEQKLCDVRRRFNETAIRIAVTIIADIALNSPHNYIRKSEFEKADSPAGRVRFRMPDNSIDRQIA